MAPRTSWIHFGLIWTLCLGSLLMAKQSFGDDEMLTTNVIHRTFMIRYGDSGGTAFAVDWKSRQYLVTARHVTGGISGTDQISIFHDGQWKTLSVNVVGVAAGDVDVTVLACGLLLAPPSMRLEPTIANLAFSQQVYFVGFPFLWTAGGEELNRDFPLPFAKTGIVSALSFKERLLYIDAHGNRGFSGGPVVFVPHGRRGEFRVAGVVAHYPTPLVEPVVDKAGNVIRNSSSEPIAYFKENPGIVVAYDIRHATELMDANPIGFPLDKD